MLTFKKLSKNKKIQYDIHAYNKFEPLTMKQISNIHLRKKLLLLVVLVKHWQSEITLAVMAHLVMR